MKHALFKGLSNRISHLDPFTFALAVSFLVSTCFHAQHFAFPSRGPEPSGISLVFAAMPRPQDKDNSTLEKARQLLKGNKADNSQEQNDETGSQSAATGNTSSSVSKSDPRDLLRRNPDATFRSGDLEFYAVIDGKGTFIFEGRQVYYVHKDFGKPTKVMINRKRWDDLNQPFLLDEDWDFSTAKAVFSSGRNTMKLTPSQNSMELYFDDYSSSSSAYQINIAMKKLKLDSSRETGGDSAAQPETENDPPPETDAPPPREYVLQAVFEAGTAGHFLFRGNTVTYDYWGDAKYPSEVTINGKSWKDLNAPFKLDDTPDFAAVKPGKKTNKSNKNSLQVERANGGFDLWITGNNRYPVRYSIPIDLEKQALRLKKDEPDEAETQVADADENSSPSSEEADDSGQTPEAVAASDGSAAGQENGDAAGQSVPDRTEEEPLRRTLACEMEVAEAGTFVFEEDEIHFVRSPSPYPDRVIIDGRPWSNLDKPFMLGFTPDFTTATITVRKGGSDNETIKLTSFPDKMELDLNNHGSSPFRYRFEIAMKEQAPDSEWSGNREIQEKQRALEKLLAAKESLPPMTMVLHPVSEDGTPIKETETEDHSGKKIQFGDSDESAAREETISFAEVLLEADITGQCVFKLEKDQIIYEHIKGKYPAKVTVNGMPWDSLGRPFVLGFVPEYSATAIVTIQGRNTFKPTLYWNRLELLVDDYDVSSSKYKFTILLRKRSGGKK